MKKLLGVALMLALCASSAFASGVTRVQGLQWGTWTPQGFVASSDTTFLNGANLAASISHDTTGLLGPSPDQSGLTAPSSHPM